MRKVTRAASLIYGRKLTSIDMSSAAVTRPVDRVVTREARRGEVRRGRRGIGYTQARHHLQRGAGRVAPQSVTATAVGSRRL